jgi:hypothetical protein
VSALEDITTKCLWCLHRDELAALNRADHDAKSIARLDPFDRVGDTETRNRSIGSRLDSRHDGDEKVDRGQRARGVVHYDHVARGQSSQAGTHRGGASLATGYDNISTLGRLRAVFGDDQDHEMRDAARGTH